MTEFSLAMQISASITTLASVWLTGSLRRWGHLVGAASQIFWVGIVLDTHIWGTAPVPAFLFVFYIRNYIRWGK